MAKGSGPIQYNELFNNDVDANLAELSNIVTTLDTNFQGLANTISKMSGKISVNIKTTNTELEKMATDMAAVDVATRGAADKLSGYSKELDDATKKSRNLKDQQQGLNTTFDLATASVDEIKARVKALTAEYNALGRATDEDKAKMASLAKETSGLKTQQETLSSALNKTKVVLDAADGSYNQISQRLQQLKKELLAMPNAFDPATGALNKANKEAVALSSEIGVLDTSLKKADAAMGVYGRNVGNYKSGFNGLGNSINQISRELPAFTFSAQTGFLALSNNIPILADNIQQTKNRIVEMRSAGEKVPSLFSQIAGAVFSWQTLLSVGVTLITVYGKQIGELFSKLLSGGKVIDETKERFKDLNQALAGTEFSKAITDINRLTLEFGLAKKGVMDKDVVLKDYNETLGKTLGTTNDFNVAEELTIANSQKYIEAQLYKAAANLSLQESAKKVVETRQKNLEIEEKLNDVKLNGTGFAKAFEITSYNRDIKKNNDELTSYLKTANGIATGFMTQAAQAEGSFKKIKSEVVVSQKEVAKSQKDADAERKRAEADRQAAAKKAIKDADDLLKAQTKLAIAERERQEISDLSTATEEQRTAIIIQFEKDKLAIIEKGITERQKLYKKGTVDYIELETEKTKASGDAQEAINKATKDGLDRQLALQEKYKKLRDDILNSEGQGAYAAAEFAITSKTYKGNPQEQEAQKQDALFTLRRDALKKELTLVELRNASIKDATERELTIKKEKQDILNQLDQLGYDNFARLQDQQKAKIEQMFNSLRENSGIIGQLYGQGFGNLFDELTTNLENMVNKTGNTLENWASTIKAGATAANDVFRQGSEERIKMLESEKQSQMDIAGQNATARTNIEKEFNAKIRAEKIKQAKIDKATAIFEIVINTAVAASKAAAQTGILSPFVIPAIIALGAVQAALVAARPLPAFRKGTQNAPEGFARVGEEGAELIESRRGNMRIAHSDQVTYLERGDKVYTAEQTRKILDTNQIDSNTELHGRLSTNLHQSGSERRIKEMSIAFSQNPKAIGEEVGRRIKDLPIHQTYFDERGVSRYIQQRNTRTKYLNDRTSL